MFTAVAHVGTWYYGAWEGETGQDVALFMCSVNRECEHGSSVKMLVCATLYDRLTIGCGKYIIT